MPAFVDLTGKRFSRLVVLGRAPVPEGKRRRGYWHCHCDCGNDLIVILDGLKVGRTKSCGCLNRENASALGKLSLKHGFASPSVGISSEWIIWSSMRQRCNNPNSSSYERYGGRGVKVCKRWDSGFEAFIKDMGPLPSKAHSIERKNNNGSYRPGNCRWATKAEQALNKRNNVYIVYKGRRILLIEAIKSAGSVVSVSTARARLKSGWTATAVVETPTIR